MVVFFKERNLQKFVFHYICTYNGVILNKIMHSEVIIIFYFNSNGRFS